MRNPSPVRIAVAESGVVTPSGQPTLPGDATPSGVPSGVKLDAAADLLLRSSTAAAVPVGLRAASAAALGGGSRTALVGVTGFLERFAFRAAHR